MNLELSYTMPSLQAIDAASLAKVTSESYSSGWSRSAYDAWLDPDDDAATLHALLQPGGVAGNDDRSPTGVNLAGSDGPRLIAPATIAIPRLL